MGILTAILSISLVVLYMIISPSSFFVEEVENIYVIVSILAWASFLILTSAAVGILYDNSKQQIEDLEAAHIGILEILAKYLECDDYNLNAHSIRVANLSVKVAKEIGLPYFQQECLRAAAMLYDIDHAVVCMDTIQKAIRIKDISEDFSTETGVKTPRIITALSPVIQNAIPVVRSYNQYFGGNNIPDEKQAQDIPLEVVILALTSDCDKLLTGTSSRPGLEPKDACAELAQSIAGKTHPEVIQKLRDVYFPEEKPALSQNPDIA